MNHRGTETPRSHRAGDTRKNERGKNDVERIFSFFCSLCLCVSVVKILWFGVCHLNFCDENVFTHNA